MYRVFTFVIALILLHTCTGSIAQHDSIKRGVTVSGNSRIFGQLSTRHGNYQEIPMNFARWELNNTIRFSGIPVMTNLFLTTEQSSSRQNITGFRIGLDTRAIVRGKLEEKFRFLSLFPTLEAGNCRPAYSPLVLNGINLRGINVEFNPGSFYTAFATGRVVRAIREAPPGYQAYERNLTFGRIGLGKIRQSSFTLSLLHAKDDPETLAPDPVIYKTGPDTLVYHAETFIHGYDTGKVYILPKENYVVSAQFNLSLLKKKFLITGEAAGSLTTANQHAFGLTFDKIPEKFQEILFFNSSSRVDYAWLVSGMLKLKNTEITGNYRWIGPGFLSLGTAYLRTDINQYEGNVVQYLNKRNIRFQLFYKGSSDNLSDWKQETTRYTNWGISTSLRFRKSPWINILYSPYHSAYASQGRDIIWNSGNLNVTSGYQFRIKRSSLLTTAMTSFQNGSNNLDSGNNEMKNLNLMFSETLNLGIPVSLFAAYAVNDLETGNINRKTWTTDGRITCRGLKWMNVAAGLSHTAWKEMSDRNKLYCNMQIDLGKFGTVTLQADRNSYVNHTNETMNYREYIFRFGLAHRW